MTGNMNWVNQPKDDLGRWASEGGGCRTQHKAPRTTTRPRACHKKALRPPDSMFVAG